MLGIPIGLMYANAGEWLIHKYILHGLGKNKKSFWSFHWHEHHRESRTNNHLDPGYKESPFRWNSQGKEGAALVALGVAHAPLFPVAPFFTGAVWYSIINYYRVHKKAHIDPDWAKEKLSWHFDHHMGPNQNMNWCVTKPWFDILMGTRASFVGTRNKEETDRVQRELARSA